MVSTSSTMRTWTKSHINRRPHKCDASQGRPVRYSQHRHWHQGAPHSTAIYQTRVRGRIAHASWARPSLLRCLSSVTGTAAVDTRAQVPQRQTNKNKLSRATSMCSNYSEPVTTKPHHRCSSVASYAFLGDSSQCFWSTSSSFGKWHLQAHTVKQDEGRSTCDSR